MTQINVVLNVTVSVSIDEHIHRLQTAINGNNDVTTADPPPPSPNWAANVQTLKQEGLAAREQHGNVSGNPIC